VREGFALCSTGLGILLGVICPPGKRGVKLGDNTLEVGLSVDVLGGGVESMIGGVL